MHSALHHNKWSSSRLLIGYSEGVELKQSLKSILTFLIVIIFLTLLHTNNYYDFMK